MLELFEAHEYFIRSSSYLLTENRMCSDAFGFHRSFISLGPKSSVLSVCF